MPMPTDAPAPAASVPVRERLPVLDVLRGFALLGILIMNMPGFAESFFAEADGSILWQHPIDRFVEQARETLFSGKFNSLFSLLFGIGFTIQHTRMHERDPAHAAGMYLRRLGVLFVFGIVHAVFIWPGDVLHSYALLGVVLLLVLSRLSDRAVVVLMGLCLLYPVLSGSLRLLLVTPGITQALVAQEQAFEASNNLAFGHGSWWDMVRENARMMAYFYGNRWSLWSSFGWLVQLLLTMLLGLLAGRRRWAERVPELMPQIRRLTWLTLAVGLACGAVSTLIFETHRAPGPSPIKLLGSFCYWAARPAMMSFYALLIVRAVQHPVWGRRLAPLGRAGRMPLSNYLMQSLVCTALFQHWGLGLWLQVGPAAGMGLALVIFFGLQVPLSGWWLARHERGPMEALWARLTYRRAPALRGTAAPAPAPR